MNGYIPNRNCQCPRCRARSLMGAAVLITLGVLFLLGEFSRMRFDDSWPALLIVIGLVMYLGRAASTEGHIQPARAVAAAPPPIPDNHQSSSEVNQ